MFLIKLLHFEKYFKIFFLEFFDKILVSMSWWSEGEKVSRKMSKKRNSTWHMWHSAYVLTGITYHYNPLQRGLI